MRVITVLWVWLMICGESHAQSAKAAEEAFAKGRAFMKSKRYADACAAFELSQRLDPQYGTQFNLAESYTALDKIATAWKLYRELSRSDTNSLRRALSEQRAKRLALYVPKIRIHLNQQFEGLKVLIDATDVTSLIGAEIPFDLGHYTINAELPGYHPFHEDIDVDRRGKVVEINIVFERESISKQRTTPSRVRYSTIIIAGGGTILGFGLFAGWRALENRDTSRDLCSADNCPDRSGAEAKVDRARLWGNLSTATVIIGAAGIASGLYLWRTSRENMRAPGTASATHVQLTPAVSSVGASLVVGGVF